MRAGSESFDAAGCGRSKNTSNTAGVLAFRSKSFPDAALLVITSVARAGRDRLSGDGLVAVGKGLDAVDDCFPSED